MAAVTRAFSSRPNRLRSATQIFVVDGDRHTGLLLTKFLGELGLETTCYSDGDAALAATRSELPALVIAEVVAARLGGLELCRTLKTDERTAAAKVLIFSVIGAAQRARESGADAFLSKPIDKTRFLGVVRALLSHELELPS